MSKAMTIYLVEKQPNFGSGSIVGVWETLDVFASHASAYAYLERVLKTFEKSPLPAIVRVAERTVKP